jgi:hypothetical protein
MSKREELDEYYIALGKWAQNHGIALVGFAKGFALGLQHYFPEANGHKLREEAEKVSQALPNEGGE